MTVELFRKDSYLKSCEAIITAIQDNQICVDQTVFYALGGGQPGDSGTLITKQGDVLEIIDCYKDRESGEHLHILEQGAAQLEIGQAVELKIDWQRRYRLMRMHSCMHMLCAAIPESVTGGSIRDGSARLDFNLPNPPQKEELEKKLNDIIQGNHVMTMRWISSEEMQQQPELVKTMSVSPPVGSGQVRLVQFGDIDLQACGGTHVANSSEIGPVVIESIKNKGKQNRRITIEFA